VSDGLDPAPLPEGLGIPADDWHRSCTSSLRLIPATYKLGTMPSFQHLYEGVLPWSPISFSPSWCWSLWCGCASCSGGRGQATMSRRNRPHLTPHHPGASVAASPHPLRASPQSRIATPARMPVTSAQRPPTPATAHRAHTRTPPPRGHLHPFLPESRLCLSGLGGLGQSPCHWPSHQPSLAAAAVHRLSRRLSGDPRDDLPRQARGPGATRAGERLFGGRPGYAGDRAGIRGRPRKVEILGRLYSIEIPQVRCRLGHAPMSLPPT
jgi:hypothetical protein